MLNQIGNEVVQMMLIAGFIFFGAIVHATAQLKISRDARLAFSTTDFVINFIIATFSGTIFGLLASIFWTQLVVIVLFSAIGAFLGIAGLNKVSVTLLDLIVYKAGKQTKPYDEKN
jgi:hypothetical protein